MKGAAEEVGSVRERQCRFRKLPKTDAHRSHERLILPDDTRYHLSGGHR
jgi:hypothetical protein